MRPSTLAQKGNLAGSGVFRAFQSPSLITTCWSGPAATALAVSTVCTAREVSAVARCKPGSLSLLPSERRKGPLITPGTLCALMRVHYTPDPKGGSEPGLKQEVGQSGADRGKWRVL